MLQRSVALHTGLQTPTRPLCARSTQLQGLRALQAARPTVCKAIAGPGALATVPAHEPCHDSPALGGSNGNSSAINTPARHQQSLGAHQQTTTLLQPQTSSRSSSRSSSAPSNSMGAPSAGGGQPTTTNTIVAKPNNNNTSSSSSSRSSSSRSHARDEFGPPAWAPQPLVNLMRSTEFFARVAHIYGAYKLTQLRAAVLAAGSGGTQQQQQAVQDLWDAQHTWAGQQMYDLCISLRGFYLKAGQFIGARADFVPDQICRKLCLLQDKVPPMSPARAKQVVCEELGIDDLSEVFDWIDLQEPIGSASISQVHKAQLRRFRPDQLRHLSRREGGLTTGLAVAQGDTAWGICNSHGISLAELAAANRDVDLDHLQPGQVLQVPLVLGLEHFQQQQQQQRAASAEDKAFWGLGRLLHQRQPGSSSGSNGGSHGSNGSSRGSKGATGSAFDPQGPEEEDPSSSSSSSSEEWLQPGSSLLVADDNSDSSSSNWQQQHQSSKRKHLLQLVAPGSGSSGSWSGFGDGLVDSMLGASEAEVDHESSSSSSRGSSSGSSSYLPEVHSPAAAAVAHAAASGHVPDKGLVAVKIQYPGALQTMTLDLVNLRSVSAFLQKTELKFDLVSAVDELQKQIHLEFDFMREARVMDTIAQHLSSLSHKVSVPRSVPGLVSQRLMVMSFMEGTPLMQLRDKVAHLPKWKRDKAARLILGEVSRAYGLMILGEGLFQADGHPGNILVQRGGRVALLDYGQSKQLEEGDKLAFAELILAMSRGDKKAISDVLWRLHVSTSKDDPSLRADMAYGMFDTRGKVDPFDPKSPIKSVAIEKFPPDMFFVLRVVQLLRGMANGMGIEDFSTAEQWAPLARQAIAKAEKKAKRRKAAAGWRAQPMFDLAALASPLRLTV